MLINKLKWFFTARLCGQTELNEMLRCTCQDFLETALKPKQLDQCIPREAIQWAQDFKLSVEQNDAGGDFINFHAKVLIRIWGCGSGIPPSELSWLINLGFLVDQIERPTVNMTPVCTRDITAFLRRNLPLRWERPACIGAFLDSIESVPVGGAEVQKFLHSLRWIGCHEKANFWYSALDAASFLAGLELGRDTVPKIPEAVKKHIEQAIARKVRGRPVHTARSTTQEKVDNKLKDLCSECKGHTKFKYNDLKDRCSRGESLAIEAATKLFSHNALMRLLKLKSPTFLARSEEYRKIKSDFPCLKRSSGRKRISINQADTELNKSHRES